MLYASKQLCVVDGQSSVVKIGYIFTGRILNVIITTLRFSSKPHVNLTTEGTQGFYAEKVSIHFILFTGIFHSPLFAYGIH